MAAVPVVRRLRRVVRPRRARPGVDLAHPARSPLGTSVVRCVAYDSEGTRLLDECPPAEALASLRKRRAARQPAGAGRGSGADGGYGSSGGFVWIGLHEPSEEEFAGITELFGLHPLAVENAVEPRQRPKAEWYDGEVMYAVFKTVRYVEHERLTAASEVVATGEVVVFTGPDFVITVRHGAHGSLGPVREGLEADPERLAQGPAAVLHAVADRIVDDYLLVADAVQDDIDALENSVFAPGAERARPGLRSSAASDTGRAYRLKRELLELKRAAGPLGRPLELLSTRPTRLIAPEIRNYFRDVADHLSRVNEQIASFDALLDSILQAHLAQVSAAQNEGMRKISAWVAIVAVPTMVCGVYGMNFRHMPELGWRFGYPAVLVVIAVVCALMYRAFRRNGWL